MDKRSDPLAQQKDRENKIYTSKAEVKTNELKALTGTPQIDPLSRKMADVLTQNELASLGIQPSEPAPKKQTFTLPKPSESKKVVSKKARKEVEVLKARQESKVEEPEPTPQPESKEKTPVPELSAKNSKKNSEKYQDDEKKDEMMNNMENIQAFQAELQREYPELALNEDAEGSSFHTNELNELEEACKDLSPGNHLNKDLNDLGDKVPADGIEGGFDTKPSNNSPCLSIEKHEDMLSNKTEYEKSKDLLSPKKKSTRLINPHLPSGIDHVPQHSSLTDKKNAELFEVCSTLLKGKTEATTVTSRTPDIIRRQSLKLQESAVKANFLHHTLSPVGKFTPRCHINLTNCKSSPIFFSFRVPSDSKMKSEHGFASADSLRHQLLRNLLDNEPAEQDFYSKNLSWLKRNNERTEKIRESERDKEVDGCTFDPYFERHEAYRIENEKLDYKATLRPDLIKDSEKEFEIRIPENIIKYTALSPANNEVRHSQGFNFDKLLSIGKIMVSYTSVNHLK